MSNSVKIYEGHLRRQVAETQQVKRLVEAQSYVCGLLHIKLGITATYSVQDSGWRDKTAAVELSLDDASAVLKLIYDLLQKQVASTARHIENLKQMDAKEAARKESSDRDEFDAVVKQAKELH